MQPNIQNDLYDYLYKRQNGKAKGSSDHCQDSDYHEKRKNKKGSPKIREQVQKSLTALVRQYGANQNAQSSILHEDKLWVEDVELQRILHEFPQGEEIVDDGGECKSKGITSKQPECNSTDLASGQEDQERGHQESCREAEM